MSLENSTEMSNAQETKFCSECGQKIPKKAVICTHCGCRADGGAETAVPQIVINNQNTNQNSNVNQNQMVGRVGTPKNKWVALLLCFFIGFFGGHKFYEGKVGLGILYACTVGLFGIGVFVDFLTLLFKPTIYYVYV